MKHFCLISRSLLVIALFTGLVSCRAPKTAMYNKKGDAKEVSIPFQDKANRTSATYYRAAQSGTSPDLATARKIATLNAKSALASDISSTIRSVIEVYTDQRQVGNAIEFNDRFQEITRQVVDQELTATKIQDEKVFQRPDGVYECWVVVEMPTAEINNKLNNRISNDEKLRQDYNREQFLKIFDEEMRKSERR
jgi:hypothetical protein